MKDKIKDRYRKLIVEDGYNSSEAVWLKVYPYLTIFLCVAAILQTFVSIQMMSQKGDD